MAQVNPSDPTEPIDLARYRDGAAGSYVGVGASLRESRRERGEELRHIAAALRIRRPHLEAIEDGRFDDLPAPAYALGFVRAYADYLDLDSDWVVERFREETEPPGNGPNLNFPEASAQQSRPTAGLLAAGLALGAAAFGTWYYVQHRDDAPREMVAEVPERLLGGTAATAGADSEPDAALAPPPPEADGGAAELEAAAAAAPASAPEPPAEDVAAPDAAAAPSESEDAAAPAAEPAAEPAPGDAAAELETAAANAPANAPEPPAADSGESPTFVPFGLPTVQPPGDAAAAPAAAETPASGESRIVLRAARRTWVRVRTPDGETALMDNLEPGDVYMVPNEPGFTLTVGNAGGLEMLVDGLLLPPLGEEGEVRRDISLDADALARGAP